MKFYIEAFYPDGRQILGTGSGQNCLLGLRRPERSVAWRIIVARTNPEPWKGANRWRLVDESGRVLAEHKVPSVRMAQGGAS